MSYHLYTLCFYFVTLFSTVYTYVGCVGGTNCALIRIRQCDVSARSRIITHYSQCPLSTTYLSRLLQCVRMSYSNHHQQQSLHQQVNWFAMERMYIRYNVIMFVQMNRMNVNGPPGQQYNGHESFNKPPASNYPPSTGALIDV